MPNYRVRITADFEIEGEAENEDDASDFAYSEFLESGPFTFSVEEIDPEED